MRTASLFANSEVRPLWSLHRPARFGHGLRHRLISHAHAARITVSVWIERARQRQALAALTEYQLRDIGITRVEAAGECEKPFWR
jgi:uncharacterized protein YjiS (DUF1127 family)